MSVPKRYKPVENDFWEAPKFVLAPKPASAAFPGARFGPDAFDTASLRLPCNYFIGGDEANDVFQAMARHLLAKTQGGGSNKTAVISLLNDDFTLYKVNVREALRTDLTGEGDMAGGIAALDAGPKRSHLAPDWKRIRWSLENNEQVVTLVPYPEWPDSSVFHLIVNVDQFFLAEAHDAAVAHPTSSYPVPAEKLLFKDPFRQARIAQTKAAIGSTRGKVLTTGAFAGALAAIAKAGNVIHF